MELEISACLLKLTGLLEFEMPGLRARLFNWSSRLRTLVMCLVYALGIIEAMHVENITMIHTLVASQRAMMAILIISYFFIFHKKLPKVKRIMRMFEEFPKFSNDETNLHAQHNLIDAKNMMRKKTLIYFLIQSPFPLFYTFFKIADLYSTVKFPHVDMTNENIQILLTTLAGYWWFIVQPWQKILFNVLNSFAFWQFTFVLSAADSFINCCIFVTSEQIKFLAETVSDSLKPAPYSTNITLEFREWLCYHRHTRRLVELVSDTFAMQLSIIIFYYISNISIMVYFFVLGWDITILPFLVFYLIQPYFYCRAGERLKQESSLLAENVKREVLRQVITGELKHGTMTNAIEDLIEDCGPKNYPCVQPIGFGALSKVLFAKLLYTSNYWLFALMQWKPINNN
ncbi:Hypothetical predicted protein [Cloeon dipterum]|uniref:Odorant receptor n=1 Tax=Cloeon dipterum TaxID=197152 RepID=A0A8S1CF65_9INSE|nr:Hypothetical predicted protein [Cloeon dipterum]